MHCVIVKKNYQQSNRVFTTVNQLFGGMASVTDAVIIAYSLNARVWSSRKYLATWPLTHLLTLRNFLQEERRIVYVGRIPTDYTKSDLRRRFGRFGVIEDVSVHFREHG